MRSCWKWLNSSSMNDTLMRIHPYSLSLSPSLSLSLISSFPFMWAWVYPPTQGHLLVFSYAWGGTEYHRPMVKFIGWRLSSSIFVVVSFDLRGHNKRFHIRSACFDLVQTAAVIIGLFIESAGVSPPWDSAFVNSGPYPLDADYFVSFLFLFHRHHIFAYLPSMEYSFSRY